jgi:hypothetical protein
MSLAELFVSLSYTSAMGYLETLKIVFKRSVRFKVIVLYVLDKFAPEETHIMAGISI